MNDLIALVTGNIPELIMMIAGFVLLVLEMYIPGFGLAGISGTVLMIGGIALMGPTPLQALILILISVILLSIAFSLAMHSISKGRLSRSKLVLNEALNQKESTAAEDISYFIGKIGQTRTALRPAGIAEFDGVKLNVQADGEYIPKDVAVRVERVDGSRVLVRRMMDAN